MLQLNVNMLKRVFKLSVDNINVISKYMSPEINIIICAEEIFDKKLFILYKRVHNRVNEYRFLIGEKTSSIAFPRISECLSTFKFSKIFITFYGEDHQFLNILRKIRIGISEVDNYTGRIINKIYYGYNTNNNIYVMNYNNDVINIVHEDYNEHIPFTVDIIPQTSSVYILLSFDSIK